MLFSKNSVGQTPCPNAPSGAVTYINPSWSGALPSTPIVIDGTLTITSSATLTGNTDVYFTPGSSVQIGAGATFTISASALDGCGQYWDGIYATSSTTGIVVTNSTVISHMENGIYATDGALIQVDNSRFIDNAIQSIYLYNNDFTNGSYIVNNTFETVNSPLGQAPYATQIQSTHGIFIEDCALVDIGNSSDGNTFHQLYNGINITWGIFNPSPTIGIHNCNFEDIQDVGVSDFNKVGQTFTTFNGAGIYSDFIDAAGLYDLNLTVDNTLSNSGNVFNHCDKGIATLFTHLTAYYLMMEDNLMGIMNASDMHNYDIHDNNIYDNDGIDDNHMGIVVNDAYASLNVSYNEVLVDHPVFNVVNIPPYGIRIVGTSQTPDPSSVIDHNHVRILTPAGVGIENSNGNDGQYITYNYIEFLSIDPAGPTNYFPKSIYGISNLNSLGTLIMHNRVDGIDPFLYQTVFEHTTSSTGIYMYNTDHNILRCNKVKYTAYGIYADEFNVAALVNANNMWNCVYPWYFFGGVGAGDATFGDIGLSSPATDMENSWLCLEWAISGICVQGVCNPNAFKIFRDNPTSLGDYIFTNPLLITQPESSTNGTLGYEYQITPISSTLQDDPCSSESDFQNLIFLVNGIPENEYRQFKMTADEGTNSNNIPDFGVWYSRMKLIRELDDNIALRNSDTSFFNFYNQNINGTLGQVLLANKSIELFKNPAPDIATFEQRHADALAANDQINSTLIFEQNEKLINSQLIKTHYIGNKNLSIQDKDDINYYAHGCPHEVGTAVYKAQSLWAFFRPGEYYNYDSFCQNSLNKINWNITKSSYPSSNQISIYPNPATSEITINYTNSCDGVFRLYDVFGKEVYITDLPKASVIRKISIPTNVQSGLYYYKGSFGNENLTGKLTIIR